MQIIEKTESNKSEEFKQINTNRETDSNSYESNGIEHDMNSSSDEHVYETPSKQQDEQIQKLQDDFHFENANHAKINNSNETGNQSNISHSKRSQYSTNESKILIHKLQIQVHQIKIFNVFVKDRILNCRVINYWKPQNHMKKIKIG